MFNVLGTYDTSCGQHGQLAQLHAHSLHSAQGPAETNLHIINLHLYTYERVNLPEPPKPPKK
eukprot:1410148-Amphidinium_carterae.1